MNSFTRRGFLEKLSVVALGGMATGAWPQAFGAGPSAPHIAFPSAARDRISVASYPFRAYIESPTNHDRDRSLPGMDLTDFAAEVVKKFNVRNIEPAGRHFRSLDSAYLASFREALKKAGVKAVDIAVDGPDRKSVV